MECMMDHIVLNVEDMAGMLDFYTEVMRFTPERLEEYRAGRVPFPSVRLSADTIIDLFPKNMWQQSVQQGQGGWHLNHFCIAVRKENWQELVKRLKANKIAIEEGPVPRWGAHGTGISIYFRDPEGTLIEARYYEGENDEEECLLGS